MTRATLRVRGLTGSPNRRPERVRVEQAAKALKDQGFDVIGVGRFGVTVASEDENFTRVLGVKPEAALVAPVQPKEPELKDLVDLIQVDSEPLFFSKTETV